MWLNVRKIINKQIFNDFYKYNNYRTITNVTTQSNPPQNEDSYELKQTDIDESIAIQPLLAAVSKQLWNRTHETFMNHGLSTKNFLQIVIQNPAVLSRSPQKNSECIENWRSCQFGENLLSILLTTYPELLNETNERLILQRITFLKSFANTNKNVWKLLMGCPNLFVEQERVIEEKMNYMLKTMRIEMHEIVKSKALAKSLDEIRCRHVFLQRLNMFTLRSLREEDKQPTNNQHLTKILDTNDKNFAINVARVSVEEFETFKELFAREIEQKEKSEDDDDDLEDD